MNTTRTMDSKLTTAPLTSTIRGNLGLSDGRNGGRVDARHGLLRREQEGIQWRWMSRPRRRSRGGVVSVRLGCGALFKLEGRGEPGIINECRWRWQCSAGTVQFVVALGN